MIKRLELNYFKKHEHLEVDFLNGLNGITGKNYHGKSTILQGVMFCLGGSRMVPGNRLATRGTNSGFKQRLWFAVAGKGDFFVERTKTSANLHKEVDGERTLVASGAGPVNNAVAELLGMPLRRFAQIKFTKAKAADAILKFGSTELFKIITEITGLSRITEVLERITADLSVQRKLQEVLVMVELGDKRLQLSALEGQLAGAASAVAHHEDRLTTLIADRAAVDLAERTLRDAVSQLFNQQREFARADEQVGLAIEQLRIADESLGSIAADRALLGDGDVSSWVAEQGALQAQERAARGLAGEVAALTREAAGLEPREAELKDAFDRATKALAATPAPEPGAEERAEAALNLLKSQRIEAHHAVEHASSALTSGACPSCKREYEGFSAEAAQQELEAASQRLNTVLLEIRKATQDQVDVQAVAAAHSKATLLAQRSDGALADFQSLAAKTRHALAVKAKELAAAPSADALQKQIQALEAKIHQARELASEEKHLRAKIESSKELLEKYRPLKEKAEWVVKRILDEAGVGDRLQLENRVAAAQVSLQRADSVLASGRTALDEQRAEHGRLQTEVRLLQQEIEAGEKGNQRAQEVAARAVQLEELQRFIRDNRDRYSKQAWDVFMASASMFASSATGGAIESISRSDDGAFTFMEDGFEMTLDEASGAQQAIIGTAVQMALAEAAQSPLDILLMDEPTADMDPEHALAFSTLLAASGKQVVMVTHRELDGSVFNHSITL